MNPTTLFNFELVLVGGILGILGQGVRVLIGLKKLHDTQDKYQEAFNAGHMRLTIFIGFVTGGIAALSMQKEITQDVAFSLIGIGYLGVDFLEGLFLAKIAPKLGITSSKTTTTAVAAGPQGESGGAAAALVSTTTVTSSDAPKPTGEKIQENTTQLLAASQTGTVSVVSTPGVPIFTNTFRIEYPFPLSASVGLGAPNQPADVLKLKNRLHSLGFNWTPLNTEVDGELINIINLFQSIIRGYQRVYPSKTDGVVSVPGPANGVYEWLQAENAPKWTKLDKGSKSDIILGYFNTTMAQNDDFGTHWLVDTIKEAGSIYYQTYLKDNPTASVIYINDMSESQGGDVADHAGHETGLMVDILLPGSNGVSGGLTYRSQLYDQAATRQILKAFHQCRHKPEYIYFNDPDLVNEGLCKADSSSHDNHIHLQIKVPSKLLTHFV